jgi:hypothetical protein
MRAPAVALAALLIVASATCRKATVPPAAPPPAADASAPAPAVDAGAVDAAPPLPKGPMGDHEGILRGLQAGDRACYVELDHPDGQLSIEGSFELCADGSDDATPLIGKHVTYKTRKANVLAASCDGDMDCGKSDVVDLIETITVVGPPLGAFIGLDAAAAVAILGEPKTKSEPQQQTHDVSFYTEWAWPTQGVKLGLNAQREDGPFQVAEILCEGVCTLVTDAKVGVGSRTAEVEKVYAGKLAPKGTQPHHLAVEEPPGTYFTFERGKVKRVQVGIAETE